MRTSRDVASRGIASRGGAQQQHLPPGAVYVGRKANVGLLGCALPMYCTLRAAALPAAGLQTALDRAERRATPAAQRSHLLTYRPLTLSFRGSLLAGKLEGRSSCAFVLSCSLRSVIAASAAQSPHGSIVIILIIFNEEQGKDCSCIVGCSGCHP